MSKILDINSFYKATRIKIVQFWHEGRCSVNEIGYKYRLDPYVYAHLNAMEAIQ